MTCKCIATEPPDKWGYCTARAPNGDVQCMLPAGHPGPHGLDDGYSWPHESVERGGRGGMTAPIRRDFFMDHDNSGHWYVIPEAMREEWTKWANLDEDDEAAWEPPDGVLRLNRHPSSVVFTLTDEQLEALR